MTENEQKDLLEIFRMVHKNGWAAVTFTREDAETAYGGPIPDEKWELLSSHQLWEGLSEYLWSVGTEYLQAVVRDVVS